jgi:hypothetical protein
MPKLITGVSNYQTEEVNRELLDHVTRARDSHAAIMDAVNKSKAHIPVEHHDEFNRHFIDMINSFGRMKDLINKHVTKG